MALPSQQSKPQCLYLLRNKNIWHILKEGPFHHGFLLYQNFRDSWGWGQGTFSRFLTVFTDYFQTLLMDIFPLQIHVWVWRSTERSISQTLKMLIKYQINHATLFCFCFVLVTHILFFISITRASLLLVLLVICDHCHCLTTDNFNFTETQYKHYYKTDGEGGGGYSAKI